MKNQHLKVVAEFRAPVMSGDLNKMPVMGVWEDGVAFCIYDPNYPESNFHGGFRFEKGKRYVLTVSEILPDENPE